MSSTLNPDAPSGDYIDRTTPEEPIGDEDLIVRIADGDEAAFAEIYRRYHQGLYNYLVRLIHEETVAEELLQEIFVALWQGAAAFQRRASVKTWIFRIGHNQAVSWLRRASRRERIEQLGQSVSETSVEGRTAATLRADRVRAALEQLSTNHRAVVELAYVQELSYAEIARIMDCPVGTVKSRMSYALKHLDGLLRMQGEE